MLVFNQALNDKYTQSCHLVPSTEKTTIVRIRDITSFLKQRNSVCYTTTVKRIILIILRLPVALTLISEII